MKLIINSLSKIFSKSIQKDIIAASAFTIGMGIIIPTIFWFITFLLTSFVGSLFYQISFVIPLVFITLGIIFAELIGLAAFSFSQVLLFKTAKNVLDSKKVHPLTFIKDALKNWKKVFVTNIILLIIQGIFFGIITLIIFLILSPIFSGFTLTSDATKIMFILFIIIGVLAIFLSQIIFNLLIGPFLLLVIPIVILEDKCPLESIPKAFSIGKKIYLKNLVILTIFNLLTLILFAITGLAGIFLFPLLLLIPFYSLILTTLLSTILWQNAMGAKK